MFKGTAEDIFDRINRICRIGKVGTPRRAVWSQPPDKGVGSPNARNGLEPGRPRPGIDGGQGMAYYSGRLRRWTT
jgi:hypothetical protein